MAVKSVAQRNSMVDKYKADCTHIALTSTVPADGAPGTELAVTRQPSQWGSTASSSATASPSPHAVGAGLSVAGMQFMDASTGGNFRDGAAVTSQTFSSAGTYQVSASFVQQ
jgi:hypothetical protein